MAYDAEVMCEPYHSIVQFEPPPSMNDDDDRDFHDDGGSGSPPSRITRYISNAVKWVKKIGSRWHLSKMGEGHTGAVGSLDGIRDTFLLPERTLWEAAWWNRTLKKDGRTAFLPHQEPIAYAEAKKYADIVSIGSLHSLRQFLENSIRNSQRPSSYVWMIRQQLLNQKGRKSYEHKLIQAFGKTGADSLFDRAYALLDDKPVSYKTRNEYLDRLVKIVLGFTRKRDMLVPEWSDDLSLWVPPTRPVVAVV